MIDSPGTSNKQVMPASVLRRLLIAALALVSIACASHPVPIKPGGRPPLLLLGEVHDNPDAHRARLEWLRAAVVDGWRPALAMEQFDREQQPLLDQVQRNCRTADCLITQVGTAKWDWPLYQPLIQLALDHQLPILAANVSRADAGKATKQGLDAIFDADTIRRFQLAEPLPGDIEAAQLHAILEGHCRMLPEAAARTMIPAQVARDVWMAKTLQEGLAQQGGAVLIAGNGHVRRDVGVVRWLPPALAESAQVHGFLESGDPIAAYDVVHVVKPHARPDPCVAFRKTP